MNDQKFGLEFSLDFHKISFLFPSDSVLIFNRLPLDFHSKTHSHVHPSFVVELPFNFHQTANDLSAIHCFKTSANSPSKNHTSATKNRSAVSQFPFQQL
jgi:hypothetical protein